jgi:transcriptional regulator of acetoin/glycerol metabolism
MPDDLKQIRAGLRAAAAKRAKSDQLRRDATEQTVAAVRAARKAGLPATEIAELVGMSRVALYEMMERHGIVRPARS